MIPPTSGCSRGLKVGYRLLNPFVIVLGLVSGDEIEDDGDDEDE
jgi:hypothetical protein